MVVKVVRVDREVDLELLELEEEGTRGIIKRLDRMRLLLKMKNLLFAR